MNFFKQFLFSLFIFLAIFFVGHIAFAVPTIPTNPTCIVTANPQTVNPGHTSVIKWVSDHADLCNSGGNGTGTTGIFNVSPLVATSYPIFCTRNAQTVPNSCSGSYTAVVGACEGVVGGSTGSHEGESCAGLSQSVCNSGMEYHGCHWNTNATASVSCSALTTFSQCSAHNTCLWNPGYTIPSATGSCSTTVSIEQTAFPPSGTISAVACIIPAGGNSCISSPVKWNTTNLTADIPFEVTRNNPNNTHISFNFSDSISNTINYGTSTYYLYYAGNVLNSATAKAKCIEGTFWNGVKCATHPPTGTITASSCVIPEGGSMCESIVKWNTYDLAGGVAFEVTRNNPNNTHISFSTSGNISNTVNYGHSTYYLYYDGSSLDSTVANATCIDGTVWNGTKCISVPLPPDSQDCGLSNGGFYAMQPELDTFCSDLSLINNIVPNVSGWNWNCRDSACSAYLLVTESGCGSANGGHFLTQPPTHILCSAGSFAGPVGSSDLGWDWSCGESQTHCSATKCVLGEIGCINPKKIPNIIET